MRSEHGHGKQETKGCFLSLLLHVFLQNISGGMTANGTLQEPVVVSLLGIGDSPTAVFPKQALKSPDLLP